MSRKTPNEMNYVIQRQRREISDGECTNTRKAEYVKYVVYVYRGKWSAKKFGFLLLTANK